MGKHNGHFHFIRLLLLLLQFSSLIECFQNNFDESLDAILHDHAFRVMIHHRPHTGALYNATLPSNLAGIKVSAVGLRSKTLWRKGANFSDFMIPPRTLPVPYVKRLLIVYHNLGNWSSLCYTLSGYSMVTPVVGFLVYDATHLGSKNLSRLELNTMGNPILIEFHNSTTWNYEMAKCAAFGTSGEVSISEVRLPNECYSRNQGHFSIVVPLKKQRKMRPFWVAGFLSGLVGLVLVGFAGGLVVRSFLRKRNGEGEKEAKEEEECLETYWTGGSKMPRAEFTRTQTCA